MTKRKAVATLVITTLTIAIIGVLLYFYGQPLFALFSDPEKARALITQAGPFGPLVFILMQVAQVIVAPIPGQVTGFLSGFLFGTFWGTVYTMIGAAIGFTFIFWLARKLGRPFVERFVDRKMLDKFDYIADSNGVMVLFLIFLLPAFPDDVICYLAGLTRIKMSTLIIISLLGRFPGLLVLNITGSGVAESNIQLVATVVTGLAIITALAFWQRKRLEQWTRRLARKKQ